MQSAYGGLVIIIAYQGGIGEQPPPLEDDFLLLDNTNMLLLDGTNLELL